MRKAEIARRIHQQTGLRRKRRPNYLMAFLRSSQPPSEKGTRLPSPDLVSLRNFKTGESLIIPARRVMTFRSSGVLSTDVNAVQQDPIRVLA